MPVHAPPPLPPSASTHIDAISGSQPRAAAAGDLAKRLAHDAVEQEQAHDERDDLIRQPEDQTATTDVSIGRRGS
jgi:hypothetical protein